MSAAATANPTKKKTGEKPGSKYVTWEEFEEQYLSQEDSFKYEWTNGIIEKTPRYMNSNQLFIIDNLLDLIEQLRMKDPSINRLYSEGDFFISDEMHRRPDLAYLTKEQVKMAVSKKVIVPDFVIEVISTNVTVNNVMKKVSEYFGNGVKLIWQIYPELKEVHIYEDAHGSSILRGDEKCSAEKVIPGFVLSVNDIFKLP
jgi:Uma2 family endonuclease